MHPGTPIQVSLKEHRELVRNATNNLRSRSAIQTLSMILLLEAFAQSSQSMKLELQRKPFTASKHQKVSITGIHDLTT
ncbi:hypothetical protein DSO57_1033719 [Entomophthora muscae]|uniref:Uncharacterized protein n=1 Tax=Entomophthora muscae TaxID=34485 RepID=A0ACC2T022_9FUNG|nr:hypothetical protein DSO57_1033719 [Entomophthora muscae]